MVQYSSLLKEYLCRKSEIKSRLEDFEKVFSKSDEEIFTELAFCIFTPQSSALKCDCAVKRLEKEKLLLKGSSEQIAKNIAGVRFHNNKSRYLTEARAFFSKNGKISLKKFLKGNNFELRDFLVKNIKGLGYKESSHFLRNIGLGKNLAILDRHILKNLKKFKAIAEIPKTLNSKKYLEIEQKMFLFSKKVKIPMEELDLLFWSIQTGKVFK